MSSADDMFALARAIRKQAEGDETARVTPETVARIAAFAGALAQHVEELRAYIASADTPAPEAAAAPDPVPAPPIVPAPDPTGLRCGNCRHFRPREIRPDHVPCAGRIAGAGTPDGSCGLRDPGRQEGLTRWCNETDWCDAHEPVARPPEPGA